jgi:hypothetical protein
MATREDLQDWVVEALREHGGRARIVQICKHIWSHHKAELRASGDFLYTWQYDTRWAGKHLRDRGVLKPVHGSRNLPLELA